jgi:hypothetical protein
MSDITAHRRYLSYVLRHKWFVFLACLRYRVPLRQAIFHDWHKFRPSEWCPYVAHFYGNGDRRKSTTYYDAANTGDEAYDYAWLGHQHKGAHHWQHWMLTKDDGTTRALRIPDRYIREMVADWSGAGRALGHGNDTLPWYTKNRSKMQLHTETRQRVEQLIGYQEVA